MPALAGLALAVTEVSTNKGTGFRAQMRYLHNPAVKSSSAISVARHTVGPLITTGASPRPAAEAEVRTGSEAGRLEGIAALGEPPISRFRRLSAPSWTGPFTVAASRPRPSNQSISDYPKGPPRVVECTAALIDWLPTILGA
jgi:hypothetical protein